MTTGRHVAVRDLKKVSEALQIGITIYEWRETKNFFANSNSHGKEYKD